DVVGGRLGQQPAQAGQGRGQRRGHLGLAGAGAEVAEGVDERHVGEAHVADLHAAADQHPDPAALGPGGELVEQPGLADAGVAGDQPDRRPAALGPVEQAEQALELLGPADEAGGGCGGHAGKYGAPADSGAPELSPDHLRTRPPCITKGTSASSPRSSSGSPGTAITSAWRPGARAPTRSCQPSSSAATTVAERMAAIGGIPWRTMEGSWRAVPAGGGAT